MFVNDLLDATNLVAAVLNIVIASLLFAQARRLHAPARVVLVLGAFFVMRAVDRLAAPGTPGLPYSPILDLAINLTLIALLGLVAVDARRLVTGLAASLVEARSQAQTDRLTGTANRHGWEPLLETGLELARQQRRPYAVALIDVDHFKRYNDEHGHKAGDALLASAARQWGAVLRDRDTLGRYGGEEFVLLLPGCDLAFATDITERVRRETPGGQTCTAGVALWNGIETAGHLLERADAALYRGKAAGRDQTVQAGAEHPVS